MTTVTAPDLLRHFAPVGLAELDARASLQERTDRKYLVDLADLDSFLGMLPGDTRVLEIDDVRGFGYHSRYYDTDGVDSYLLAARGRRRRWKVRVRTYADSGHAYLEVKTTRHGRTLKQRTPMAGGRLDGHGLAFVTGALAAAGIDEVPSGLKPVLTTTYRRSTLLLPGSGGRVTIDRDLCWGSHRSTGGALGASHVAIVETKTVTAPGAADRALWAHGHRPVRVSKYATGLAALHGDLPHARWARTLRRLSA
ncbi:polyphosphate polymerase domain-containing protein [Mariniluteicoccus flavus]